MTAIGLVYFFLALMIVGGAIRLVEYRFPDSRVAQALAVIY